jgi:hypothetical protein
MTINMMLILKNTIASSELNKHDKRLLWAVSTMAFAGAFRGGEILSKHEATYDPDFTLLTKNVTWSYDKDRACTVHVCLKCPKETKSAAPTIVDLFQNNGPLCPVKAFLTWHKLKNRDSEKPLFRLDDGTPLTGTRMNRYLGKFLDPYTEKNVGTFKMHSFRIRLASMLGNLGFTDAQVQDAERWSSRAFKNYLKLKRTKRQICNISA